MPNDRASAPPPAPPGCLSRREALAAGAAGMAWLMTLGHTSPALLSELAQLAGPDPMTGARLASILRAERAQWQALLARVGLDRMEQPGVEGEWSMKELVAHLTWYERAVLDGARQVFSTGTFTRPQRDGETMDERNARIATESRARPLADVLAEADAVFGHLLSLIESIPDDLLNDASRLGLPDDVPPWLRVANNSYAHYRQHAEAVRVWLAAQR
ncbi:MAG: DinB family protein [Ktedonobacterales bacterium]